ncbi:MAG TPA: hypothetical protein VFP56_10380 [Candidatus Limnocylindrales bacterium]|nr:hypothetical protein [Candidatus Limnocylindrales bacterium]
MTDNFERALQERLLARSQVSPRDVEALRLFARTLPARRSLWRRPAFQWALSAAAVVLAAVIALPLLFRTPGFGTNPSPQPTAVPSQPAPSPSASPLVPVPSSQVPLGIIRLAPASGSVVNVSIDDPDGLLTGALAEPAAPTMSVRWFDALVGEAGPSAIRVTWVGFARDEEVQLDVSRDADGKLVLHFVQQAPPPASDGEGEDRVLVLELAAPIDPANVKVTFDYPA